jgi:thioredoxin-related protein
MHRISIFEDKHNLMKAFKNVFLVFLLVFTGSFYSAAQSDSTAVEDSVEANSEIHWVSFEEALELNKTAPKKWLVDVSTSWCGWCKRMDATTFSDPVIIEYVNANYYAVSLDGEEKEDIVMDDVTFKFVDNGKRGYHELPAKLMNGKMSYPTIVFLNSDVEVYQALPGYKSNVDFLPIIQFINTFEANPDRTWDEFITAYESPYTQ